MHVPPPYGGGEIRSLKVNNYFKNLESYRIVTISRKKANKKTQGRLTTTNFLYSIWYIVRIIFNIFIYLPGKIYIGIPKDFFSFLRTSVIIIVGKISGVKIYGELAGTSFRFMDDKNKMKYKYGKYIFKKIDSMRFLGNNILEYGKNMGFKKIVIFDNGIDIPEEFRIKDEIIFKEELKVLYVGSIEELKGIYNIIETIRKCKENNFKIKFSFIGEWVSDVVKEKAMKLIDKYGIENYIEFKGLKIGKEKWEVYSNNVLLIHPTFWDGQPISILEAMGLGLGVISTKVGAIPDTVIDGYNGILLKENNPQCLYEAIEKFYYDRNFLKTVSENNIETYNKRFKSEIFLQNFKKWIDE